MTQSGLCFRKVSSELVIFSTADWKIFLFSLVTSRNFNFFAYPKEEECKPGPFFSEKVIFLLQKWSSPWEIDIFREKFYYSSVFCWKKLYWLIGTLLTSCNPRVSLSCLRSGTMVPRIYLLLCVPKETRGFRKLAISILNGFLTDLPFDPLEAGSTHLPLLA